MSKKLDKIIALAENGATEGERNAAKAAAKKITDRNADALISRVEERRKLKEESLKAHVKVGKTFTNVVFLQEQNPYTKMWEVFAYFPDLYWDYEKKMHTCYQHVGQHGPCIESYVLVDCKAPSKKQRKAVERLKYELEHRDEPYALTVLDPVKWLQSKGKRREEIESAVKSMSCTTSVAEQLEQLEQKRLAEEAVA